MVILSDHHANDNSLWAQLAQPLPDPEYATLVNRLNAVLGPTGWSIEGLDLLDYAAGCVALKLQVAGVVRIGVAYADTAAHLYVSGRNGALRDAARQFGIGGALPQALPAGPVPTPIRPAPAAAVPEPEPDDEPEYVPVRPPTPAPAGPAATEPQVKAIYAIARGARHWENGETDAECEATYGVAVPALTRRQASEFIEALKVVSPKA